MKRKPKVTKKELLMAVAEIKNSDKVKKAMEIAQNAHKSQVRDGGGSYLTEHIYYLTSLIYADYKNDPRVEDLVIISLLHDSVEDGEVSLLYLKELFGERISDIIGLLSKPNDDDDAKTQEEKYLTNQNYLHNMSSNEEAIIVKLYDRLANINCIMEDNVVLKPEKYKRYVLEVRNLFIPLAKKYKFSKILTEYEKEVDRIEKLFNGM